MYYTNETADTIHAICTISYCQHNQTIGMFSSSSTDPTLEECWPRIL